MLVADSYVVLDLMRLPLGILSGWVSSAPARSVRRINLVQGVTTAATLWFVTVLGLCFGDGQHRLGLAAMASCGSTGDHSNGSKREPTRQGWIVLAARPGRLVVLGGSPGPAFSGSGFCSS